MNIFSDIFGIYGVIWQSTVNFWWVILPVTFYLLFKAFWMDYVIGKWLSERDYVMIELFPPKEVERSPKVMESVFAGIAGVSNTINPMDMYCKGTLMSRFSFEIVGEEGRIHFYVRMERKYRKLIEANLYAQYPDAEIVEVEDYISRFPRYLPNKDWDLWGSDVQLVNPDPYPIKTWDRFEEDVTGQMIDPLAAMSEVMVKLPPGQHIWLQYVVSPHLEKWNKAEKQKKVVALLAGRAKENKSKGFFGDLAEVIGLIFKAFAGPVEFKKSEKKEEQPLEFRLTPGEKATLKAVEENLGMNSFETKMRLIYLGKREGFDKSFVSTFFGTIKQFNDQNLNSFKPYDASKTQATYMFKKRRILYRQRKIYRRFRDRDMDGLKIVLSMREMASVFHFPDMSAKSPSIVRIEAKRGSAPANLPIQ